MGCAPSRSLLEADDESEAADRSRTIDRQLRSESKTQSRTITILLLGAGESGKSTLLKQIRLLYGTSWTSAEREDHASVIVTNTLSSIRALIEAVDLLHGLGIPDAEAFRDAQLLLATDLFALELASDVVDAIERLWALPVFQRAYERRNEFQLNDSAQYLLDRIGTEGWIPTDQDMLQSRVVTTGITESFFDVGRDRWRVTDVGGQRSERRKWLSCFEGVSVLVFLVATSEFDQLLYEDESVNRLAESVTLFSSTINSPFFANTAVCVIGLVLALTSISILLLNKVDLFAAKLKTRRLGDYLKGYDGDNSFKSGLSAMRRLFERLRKPTGTSTITGQTLHTHATCATDTRTIQPILRAVQDQILRSLLSDVYRL